MDQEQKIVGVIPFFITRLRSPQIEVINSYFQKWTPDKILYDEIEQISMLTGSIPNFELQPPDEVRCDPDAFCKWIVEQVDVLLIPIGAINRELECEVRASLAKADAQYVSISPDGFQFCSGSPDDFHIPRRGRSTLSHLTRSLIQANAAGLITPDQMQTALDTKVLPEWLSERLRTL